MQLDSNLGDAYYYKAICHADQKAYGLAISEMLEACRLHGYFEDDDKTIGARWISYWHGALEDFDSGMQVLEDALRQHPGDDETVTLYVQLATETGHFTEAVDCLRNLGNKLPRFLLSEKAEMIQRNIRRTAQMTRRVNSLKRAYQRALTEAGDEKEIARARKALFMIRAENQEEDMAIDLFREVYQFEDGPKQLRDWGRYIGLLCELLFWGLHLNGEDSEPFGNHLDLLICMEKNEHSLDSNALTYGNFIAGLFLGQFYRLHNRLDESKIYFKDRVTLAMSLLEDDDVSNDWQAYDILSETMFKAGDDINGKAARIMFLHEWKKSQIDGTTTQTGGDVTSDAIDNNANEGEISNEAKANDGETTEPEVHKINEGNGAAILNSVTTGSSLGEKAHTQSDAKVIDETSTLTAWDCGSCDGPCLREFNKTDRVIHVCTNCYDVAYCDPCFNKYVFAGTLPYKKCDSTHHFVSVTGSPKDLDDTKVVVEGSIRDRQEWLNSIRTAWGLDEWHSAPITSEISPAATGARVATTETVSVEDSTGEKGKVDL